jgi:hypothetical protein
VVLCGGDRVEDGGLRWVVVINKDGVVFLLLIVTALSFFPFVLIVFVFLCYLLLLDCFAS